MFLRNRVELLPGSDNWLRDYMRRPLWLLVALTGAVLLLACANLANLLLARATAREREFAVRLAIGASRARIVRQLLVECLLLSGAGALLGLALAFLADRVLEKMYLSADAASQFAVSSIPDARVLLVALCAMFFTSFVFGLLPAIRGSRAEIASVITERSFSGGAGSLALRRTLVGTQLALSLLLLFGAGLSVRTLRNLENQGPGFPTEHLLTFSVNPSLNGYSDERTEDFFERLAVNLRNLARRFVRGSVGHANSEGLCVAECRPRKGLSGTAETGSAGPEHDRSRLLCGARHTTPRRAGFYNAGSGSGGIRYCEPGLCQGIPVRR